METKERWFANDSVSPRELALIYEEFATTPAERIRVKYEPMELLIHVIGPVFGINTGSGALALCGYSED